MVIKLIKLIFNYKVLDISEFIIQFVVIQDNHQVQDSHVDGLMFVLNCIKSSVIFVARKLKLLKITKRLIVLGLDNSGKTTLLHILQSPESQRKRARIAYYRFDVQLDIDDMKLWIQQFDLRQIVRQNWRHNLHNIDGIIYCIDASDPDRFEESNQELQEIIKIQKLESKPILILGNKIDKKSAVPESYLRQNLGLFEKGSVDWEQKTSLRPIQLFMCTVIRRMGYGEAFKWLKKVMK